MGKRRRNKLEGQLNGQNCAGKPEGAGSRIW